MIYRIALKAARLCNYVADLARPTPVEMEDRIISLAGQLIDQAQSCADRSNELFQQAERLQQHGAALMEESSTKNNIAIAVLDAIGRDSVGIEPS